MRYYPNLVDAFNETEREMWEMGIRVDVQSMQDVQETHQTLELQAYGFQVDVREFDRKYEREALTRWLQSWKKMGDVDQIQSYIEQEFWDRTGGEGLNPGKSWEIRSEIWKRFLHDGKFAYTYSERFAPQVAEIVAELHRNPGTRQAIITMHSYINTDQDGNVSWSADMVNKGGHKRIPCSLNWQFLRRDGTVDIIYSMRSCDFLTHFGIDVLLAHRLCGYVAAALGDKPGKLTYFTGSLHAYADDMPEGIF